MLPYVCRNGSRADRLLWPIEVPRVSLQAAAPKARLAGKKKKAGTLPLAAKCQLEAFASFPEIYLSLDHSVRIGEGVRVELWPDEDDPLTVMRGHAYMGLPGLGQAQGLQRPDLDGQRIHGRRGK